MKPPDKEYKKLLADVVELIKKSGLYTIKEKECKYPNCCNFKPWAEGYCTVACSSDHYDLGRKNDTKTKKSGTKKGRKV